MIIEVVSVSDDSEEEQEDVETPDIKRRNRWRRVAQAATKQSLRLRAVHAARHLMLSAALHPGMLNAAVRLL